MTALKLALALAVIAAGPLAANPVAARPVATRAAAPACPANLHPAVSAEIVLTGPAAEISQADWRAFVDREVEPRFPGSLAADHVYAEGDRSPFARVPAHTVLVLLTGGDRERDGVHAIRDAWREQFHDAKADVIESPACVGF
ncbi:DUF3574 domain-containing protein [Caulobacter sp. KR2-114]|uniref:DUF3574 domain-containing protein n=1 Tax=Caulobacter sp. KR2-114 TaxID=3400912 RepID=UPI003C06E379